MRTTPQANNGETRLPGRPATPGNGRPTLPPQPNALIGRERTLAAATQRLLSAGRLLTLTGAPGSGKTRLALQLAADLQSHFADGAVFVDLSPIGAASLVLDVIAQALGLGESRSQPVSQLLHFHLRDKHLLLVLDNFEQVVPAGPDVARLLESCLELRLLVTSRQPLRLRWEHVFRVPPLELAGLHSGDLATLSRVPAVALFIERARAVEPGFALTEESAPAVAEICARLDGLPLAIELAAGRAGLFPPTAMLAQLRHSLDVLAEGARDQPLRHRTLRRAIGWSYDLLDAEEQRLFRQLAVFVGGCPVEAAQAIWDGDDALALISALVEKNLLVHHQQEKHDVRVSMLDTIRAYGLERLAAAGEEEAARRRHAWYFIGLAERAAPSFWGSAPQPRQWYRRLRQEHDNLQQALDWSRSEADGGEAMLRLTGALWSYWMRCMNAGQGAAYLQEALDRAAGAPISLRARALAAAGWLTWFHGDYKRAEELSAAGVAAAWDAADAASASLALGSRGLAISMRGDLGAAQALMEEAVAVARRTGNPWLLGSPLHSLAHVALLRGDYRRAREYAQQALDVTMGLEDTWPKGYTLSMLGGILCFQGELAQAERLLVDAADVFRDWEDWWGLAYSLDFLGLVATKQGNAVRAASLFRESLRLWQESGDLWGIPRSLEWLAGALCMHGDHVLAARVLGAAETLRGRVGAPLPTGLRKPYDDAVAATSQAIGEPAFAAARIEAHAMPLDRMIDAALQAAAGMSTTSPAPRPIPGRSLLTGRAQQVADLVARGRTNQQIGRELGISGRTAEPHVANIFCKLDVDSRSQICRLGGAASPLPLKRPHA